MKNKRSIIYVLLFAVMLVFTSCEGSAELVGTGERQERAAESGAESALQIHYIDVGQGDATLILCDGHAMLIDAGNNDKGTTVQSYLTYQKVDTLDYVIGTHPDADHIGGLDVIITKFDCQTILLTDEKKDTATYRDVVDAMKYKSYQRTAPKVGDVYQLGDAEFTIVGPRNVGEASNDNSIALVLTHGENRFYFEGDAEEEEEAEIIESGIELSADVYKVGHHGSKTSTTDEMLEAVSPKYAVISVGENSYGHPSAEVLNKLRAAGIEVYRTDEQGAIVAVSDGKSITFNTSPDESWQAGEPAGAGDEEETVHITKTGKKYHRAGCASLGESDLKMTLEEAKAQGLTPCAKCDPPE